MAKCKNCKNIEWQYDLSSDGERKYNWCPIIDDCPDPDTERKCGYYEKTTNADRIRSMTDEELSKIIKHPDCKAKECGYVGSCYDCRLEWLQSPVEV